MGRIGQDIFIMIREQELRFVIDAIASGDCASIVGLSNMGKSTLLRELGAPATRKHFRCNDDVASYADACFYGGTLRLATDHSALRVPRGSRPGIAWHEVSGEVVGSANGGCLCQSEIDAVIQLLKDLAEKKYEGTIGVVTPFRQQANRLRESRGPHPLLA